MPWAICHLAQQENPRVDPSSAPSAPSINPAASGRTVHVALRIAYDGRFGAYQRDPSIPDTVEAILIEALRKEGYVTGSLRSGSRTDKGVSALENVLMAEVDRPHLNGLVPAICAHLPDGLWLTAACEVDPDWNPRFAASRTYHYHAPGQGEDLERMKDACAAFLGRHHMGAFARIDADRDPLRDILSCEVQEDGGDWLFTVKGRSFLWNQVRRMVSAVLTVGRGDAEVSDIRVGLETQFKHRSFSRAPAEGLVLIEIEHGLTWDPSAAEVQDRDLSRQWQVSRVQSKVVQTVRGGRANATI